MICKKAENHINTKLKYACFAAIRLRRFGVLHIAISLPINVLAALNCTELPTG